MQLHAGHIVCSFGGGVAGSEAAGQFAARGIHSVIFDMGALPWGKIELGLPKWHAKQRDQEEALIDDKLLSPYVHFVPSTKLGEDITLEEVLGWNFSVIILAVGAWRDRSLAIPGIDEYEGKGFYYQNPFVAWFNQYHSPDYDGPSLEIQDGAVVVGGGLASLDVVKILMLETTSRALRQRGIEVDLFELEKKGIPRVLDSVGVAWEDLGLEGCTLYYRRRGKDMPLIPLDDNPSEKKLAQAEAVRVKLLENFRKKYLFRFEPCRVPVDKVVEGDRLAGLVFQRTEIRDGRPVPILGSEETVRAPLFISSIGSVPEPLPGIPMKGELFEIEDRTTGKLSGFDNVFALGNAVTGRGNIRASRVHGRDISGWIVDKFLDWTRDDLERLESLTASEAEMEDSNEILHFLSEKRLRRPEEIRTILEKVRALQERAGYDGDYKTWVHDHLPVRLETLKKEN